MYVSCKFLFPVTSTFVVNSACALQYENNSGSCFMQWGI